MYIENWITGIGGDLLSHVLRRSTIGAVALNFRVRDGTGCFAHAMTTKPSNPRRSTKNVEWDAGFLLPSKRYFFRQPNKLGASKINVVQVVFDLWCCVCFCLVQLKSSFYWIKSSLSDD